MPVEENPMAFDKRPQNMNTTTHVATTFTVREIREAFLTWLADGHATNYSPNIIAICMEKTSEYVMKKKIYPETLWMITNHEVFEEIYNKIIANKLFRITNRKTHAVLI